MNGKAYFIFSFFFFICTSVLCSLSHSLNQNQMICKSTIIVLAMFLSMTVSALPLDNLLVVGNECPVVCFSFPHPICAKSSAGEYRTFRSECDLKKYNCQNGSATFDYFAAGNCP